MNLQHKLGAKNLRNNQDSENNKAFYYYVAGDIFYLFKGSLEGYHNAVRSAVENGSSESEIKKQHSGLLNLSAYCHALRHGKVDSSHW